MSARRPLLRALLCTAALLLAAPAAAQPLVWRVPGAAARFVLGPLLADYVQALWGYKPDIELGDIVNGSTREAAADSGGSVWPPRVYEVDPIPSWITTARR